MDSQAYRSIAKQLDAQHIMDGFVQSGGSGFTPDFVAFVYTQAGEFDLAEQVLEKAKIIWGRDDQSTLMLRAGNCYRVTIT